MIETVKEYKWLLSHLRESKAENKQSRHLDSKLEGLEEVENLINNLTLDSVNDKPSDDRIYDLSELPDKQKKEMIEVFTKLTAKHALQLFMSLGLKTHIESMVINDLTNEEFILSFKKVILKP